MYASPTQVYQTQTGYSVCNAHPVDNVVWFFNYIQWRIANDVNLYARTLASMHLRRCRVCWITVNHFIYYMHLYRWFFFFGSIFFWYTPTVVSVSVVCACVHNVYYYFTRDRAKGIGEQREQRTRHTTYCENVETFCIVRLFFRYTRGSFRLCLLVVRTQGHRKRERESEGYIYTW